MKAKLYVILGSHACRTGMLLLEHKGIEYERVELPTGLHPFALRLRGFAGNPAPFRDVDERSPRMLVTADRMGTVPALLLGLAAALRGRDGLANGGADGRLGPLLWRNSTVRLIGARFVGRFVFAASARAEPELLARLPAMLDRVDGWVEQGVLNGEALNAADYMIAPSLALLCYRPDLRPEIEQRPAIRLVDRLLPEPAA
jgi:glutathione S-transferase